MAQKTTTAKETGTSAVVPTDPQNNLPAPLAELEGMSGEGFEGADASAFAVPFIRILQSTSPQLKEENASYIPDSRAGVFFNTISGKLFGKEIQVIPVGYARDFVEWKPNRGGFVRSHGPDPAILDRVASVDEKGNSILDNGNTIQDIRNHYVLVVNHLYDGPIVLSLSSTGIRHSRKWMTLMNALRLPNSAKTAPMFGAVWSLGVVLNKNDDGEWYQLGDKTASKISFTRWVTKEELEAAQYARTLLPKARLDYAASEDGEKKEDVPF